MSTVAVSIISVFASFILLIIVIGLAALIVLHLRAQKANRELAAFLTQYKSDLTSLVDGARSSFTGIRQEIKTSQEKQDKLLANALKAHDAGFRDAIGKFNPTALEAASIKIFNASATLVRVASTLQALLVTHEVPESAADLLPEEYAAGDTIYSSISESARLDQADQRSQAEEEAPLFSGAAAE
jgi:hypothetical protein